MMRALGFALGLLAGFVLLRLFRPKKRKGIIRFRMDQVIPEGYVSLDRVAPGAPVKKDFSFVLNGTPTQGLWERKS